jgi:murein L,D-transpeptidase YafK
MTRRRILAVAIVALVIAGAVSYGLYLRFAPRPRTVDSVLAQYGAKAHGRLAPYFKRAGLAYPPRRVALLVFKEERRLAVWVADARGPWRYLRDYPVLAASGVAGPKLREGDYQVPEGLYAIEHLNPASSYHLSMKVGYPNAFDRLNAQRERRTRLGGDIFIHGKNVSIGCVAIGDPAIEELFTLVAETGIAKTRVIIAPRDLRIASAPVAQSTPLWIVQLWRSVAAALAEFPIELESNRAFDVRGMSKVKPLFIKP